MSEDANEFQKRLARIQIWSSTCTTIGGVSLGIGASMWVTAFSMLGTTNTLKEQAPFLFDVVNVFNSLGPVFSFTGFTAIMLGLLYPMYILRPKSKKSERDPNTCHCGNKLPCTIHMS